MNRRNLYMQNEASTNFSSLILRIALTIVFLPSGFRKVFFGYTEAVERLGSTAATVVPNWLAAFVAYTMPFAELYIGIALLLGFGKAFTKVLTIITTLSLVIFWYLRLTTEFTWFSDVHTWYFIAALVLAGYGFGKYSLDAKLSNSI